MRGAKGREVVTPDERLRGFGHGFPVERLNHAPGAIAIQHQRRPAHHDAIEIMPLDGAIARVERVRRYRALDNCDRKRFQIEIDRFSDAASIPSLFKIEVRDLSQRVHAGVRATRAVERRRLAAERCYRRFNRTLHGRNAGLALPTGEGRSVVFDCNAIARHSQISGRARQSYALRLTGPSTPEFAGAQLVRYGTPPTLECRFLEPKPRRPLSWWKPLPTKP